MKFALGVLAAIAFFAYGIAQLYAGYIGIADYLGTWWAVGAVLLSIFFRFTLPMTAGAIYAAIELWGWHWALATLFALPGLALMIPGALAAIVGAFNNRGHQ